MENYLEKLELYKEFQKGKPEFQIKHLFISREFLNSQFFTLLVTKENSKVFAKGENNLKQLGLGVNSNKYEDKFKEVEKLSGEHIIEFYEGNSCMFARTKDHRLYSWGCNDWGQLGKGIIGSPTSNDPETLANDHSEPEEIFWPGNEKMKVKQISCGDHHNIALLSDNEYTFIYGWGQNKRGQLYEPRTPEPIPTPKLINIIMLSNDKIRDIYSFCCTNFFITENNYLHMWGEDLWGLSEKVVTEKSKDNFKLIDKMRPEKIACYYKNFFYLEEKKLYNYKPSVKRGKARKPIAEDVLDITMNNDFKLIFKTNDVVKEIDDNFSLISSGFETFNSYFAAKYAITYKTLSLSEKDSGSWHGLNKKAGTSTSKGPENKRLRSGDVADYLNKISSNYFKCENLKYSNEFKQMEYLGSGSFGTVYEVMKKSNHKKFAIKQMWPKDTKEVEILGKEINILEKVKDVEFFVKIEHKWFEIKEPEAFIFIQMELCLGDLWEFLKDEKHYFFSRNENTKFYINFMIFKRITTCLNILHNKKIIHRDLKPSNILISNAGPENSIKLSDFGLATYHSRTSTPHTPLSGTRNFMAPEVILGAKYNKNADVYSLGIIVNYLFDFNSYNFASSKMSENDEKMIELVKEMTNIDYKERPDCKKIIEKIKDFSIEKNILKIDHPAEIEDILNRSKNSKFYPPIYSALEY